MAFTQTEFLLFLIVSIFTMSVIRCNQLKKVILLASNFYFYAYFSFRYLLLLVIITLLTYFIGIMLQERRGRRGRLILLVFGVLFNVSFLFAFKYYNFFVKNIVTIPFLNNSSLQSLEFLIPLGVSFYIFRFISYLIDTYRYEIDHKISSPIDFLIYGTFFPIVVSGPISRAKQFIPQLSHIKLSFRSLYKGYRLFIIGVFLKLFIADRIAPFVNFFYENHEVFDSATTWIATLSYSIQIYCDFAGYSSMAIGIALMLGFSVEDNFNFPYLATNISDFWRRWHITLSEWIRDYVYIPLGGNRKGQKRQYVNLILAMTLCGLWHGAAWNFVLWGFLHGIALLVNHLWRKFDYFSHFSELHNIRKFLSWLLTFATATILWIIFRSEDINQASEIIGKLFIINNNGVSWYHPFIIFIICATAIYQILYISNVRLITLPIDNVLTPTILLCLIWLAVVFFPKEFQPFVYEKF